MSLFQGGIEPTRQEIEAVLARLEAKGLDPARVPSCLPSAGSKGHVKGVRGCNVYDRCPFNLKRYGGFKGQGPQNVPYYHKPMDGSNRQQENWMECNKFVFIMLSRMKAGIRDREEGKRGNPGPEVIDVLVENGKLVTTIRRKVWVKKNPESQNPNEPWVAKRETIPVPPYEYPAEDQGDSHEAELERDRLRREAYAAEIDYAPPVLPETPTRLEFKEGEESEDEIMELANLAVPVATAEPVKGKK